MAFVGCAGVYGNSTVLRGLARLCRPGTPIARLYLRPLLTVAADGAFREDRKQFFFEHLIDSMTGRTTTVVAERDELGSSGSSPT